MHVTNLPWMVITIGIVSELIAATGVAHADPGWTPPNSARINAVFDSRSDGEYVDGMAHLIDDELSEYRSHTPPEWQKQLALTLIGQLVDAVGANDRVGAPPRTKALEFEIHSLPGDIKNRTDVKELLSIGLAIQGVSVPESNFVSVMNNTKMGMPLWFRALEGMVATKTPIIAIPKLLEMKDSDYAERRANADGTIQTTYVVRVLVVKALLSLGINSHLGTTSDVNTVWIDRSSLVSRLGFWISQGAPKERSEALQVAHDVGGKDVALMLRRAGIKSD